MATLKPCPFCGYNKVYLDEYRHEAGVRFRVVCPECMAMVDPGYFQSAGRAIEAWNRRTFEPLVNISEEVRRVKDAN